VAMVVEGGNAWMEGSELGGEARSRWTNREEPAGYLQ
jgi:hypothetical protein